MSHKKNDVRMETIELMKMTKARLIKQDPELLIKMRAISELNRAYEVQRKQEYTDSLKIDRKKNLQTVELFLKNRGGDQTLEEFLSAFRGKMN